MSGRFAIPSIIQHRLQGPRRGKLKNKHAPDVLNQTPAFQTEKSIPGLNNSISDDFLFNKCYKFSFLFLLQDKLQKNRQELHLLAKCVLQHVNPIRHGGYKLLQYTRQITWYILKGTQRKPPSSVGYSISLRFMAQNWSNLSVENSKHVFTKLKQQNTPNYKSKEFQG